MEPLRVASAIGPYGLSIVTVPLKVAYTPICGWLPVLEGMQSAGSGGRLMAEARRSDEMSSPLVVCNFETDLVATLACTVPQAAVNNRIGTTIRTMA